MKDSFGREITYLRLSVTDRCNLRCIYCMPPEGVCLKNHASMLKEEEMLRAVRAAASLGIRKVRITGGEPLVKKNILSICRGVSRTEGIEETVLTTNGTLLSKDVCCAGLRNMAEALKEAGVRRLNISIDTLDEKKYSYITRTGSLKEALCGIEAALSAGFEKIKLNAVLIGGFNDCEVRELAGLTVKWPVDMRFIELMPMDRGNVFGPGAYVPSGKVLSELAEARPVKSDGVAMLYRLPGASGNIGIISPVSSHFCKECNRIRLTADGFLKPCLHSFEEISIRGMSIEEMKEAMRTCILEKPECHAPLSAYDQSRAGRSMNSIGG